MTLSHFPQFVHAWLAMATVPKITPAKWELLLSRLQFTPEKLIFADLSSEHAVKKEQQDIIHTLRNNIRWSAVDKAMRWASASPEHHLITRESPLWPEGFKSLTSAPLVLFAHGNVSRLSDSQLAIVGSRSASVTGLRIAHTMASDIAEAGVTVTSGLATGIDGAAHKGALIHAGRTVAFLGTGVDIIYPSRNRQLASSIVTEGGALISEFFPGVGARRFHFPRRNRLIAAVSKGTLVVEASLRSGTLITANLAADMGRDVFAVPGNIHSPQSEGCHALIQQGAKLVVTAQNILDEVNPVAIQSNDSHCLMAEKSKEQNLATDKLLDSVEFDVTGVDIIAERSALPVSEVMAALLEYELRGLVAAVSGGYVKLRGK